MSATAPEPEREPLLRVGPLAAILLLHVGILFVLQRGLPQPPALPAPKEVFATFITPQPEPPKPQPQPEPARQAPAPPKTVPVVKQPAPRPKPVKTAKPAAPAVNPTPSPKAITTPPATPAPAPEPPAAAAPPPAAAPAQPAQPAPPAAPKTVSGVAYLQPPQPDYPPQSKRMGEEGKVMLRILVNEKGRPERVELQKSSGSPRLDEAARQAALRALFKPYLEDGHPVAVFVVVPIAFALQ